MKDVRNSLSSNVINASKHRFKMSCFRYLDAKKERKRLAQNGSESKPVDMHRCYLKTIITNRMTKHLFMRKDIALMRVCLVKYLFPITLEVQ